MTIHWHCICTFFYQNPIFQILITVQSTLVWIMACVKLVSADVRGVTVVHSVKIQVRGNDCPVPCLNNGLCEAGQCRCPGGYGGAQCQNPGKNMEWLEGQRYMSTWYKTILHLSFQFVLCLMREGHFCWTWCFNVSVWKIAVIYLGFLSEAAGKVAKNKL